MATQVRPGESTRSTADVAEEEEEEENEETEKVEEEVREMAERVKRYRSSMPHHLSSTMSSILAAQRPRLSLSGDVAAPSSGPHLPTGAGSTSGNSSTVLAADDGEKTADEVKLLRDKISSNIEAMPKVLKRMKECISRIDKLVSSNETIQPVFKRKKS